MGRGAGTYVCVCVLLPCLLGVSAQPLPGSLYACLWLWSIDAYTAVCGCLAPAHTRHFAEGCGHRRCCHAGCRCRSLSATAGSRCAARVMVSRFSAFQASLQQPVETVHKHAHAAATTFNSRLALLCPALACAGMRFAGADTTVKLAQGKTYIISVTTQPAVAVT